MMKALRSLILLAAVVAGGGAVRAVTAEEMEHARVITAQLYLRWANDGSGYLDELSPKTMAQLEKSLKKTEQENIRAFKAVKTPSDYASWDKEKLVAYWSGTFFKSPGLIEKGRSAKGRVKSRLSRLEIKAPAKADTPDSKTDAKADAASQPAAGADGREVVTLSGEGTAVAAPGATAADSVVAEAERAALEEVAAADSVAVSEEKSSRSSGVSVWIYVIALCILVGIVVWLVIFASKNMKSSEEFRDVRDAGDDDDSGEPVRRESVIRETAPRGPVARETGTLDSGTFAQPAEVRPVPADDSASEARLREKYAELLAGKNEEIRSLTRQMLDLKEENFRLGEEVARLRAELDSERTRAERAGSAASVAAPSSSPRRRSARPQRDIYLGRVNKDGLFVRADKEPVEGKTVYRLATSDGFTGTYRVTDDPDMQDMMLDNPVEWLGGGCVARDLADTDGKDEIVTESAGTAVFEDGCWRVLRQARISYR